MRGGLRTRLIGDSLRLVVIDCLQALGWFDPTIYDDPPGLRAHRPLVYVPSPADWVHGPTPSVRPRDAPVVANMVAISAEDIDDSPRGLGDEVEDNLRFYIDLLVESDVLGWHLGRDITDILLGRLPDVDRLAPSIDVYDLRQTTPTPFTVVDVENVTVDRSTAEERAFEFLWFMVRVDLVDEYLDEFDANPSVGQWPSRYADAWTLIQEAL